MDNLNIESFGMAVGAIAVVWIIFQNVPNVIKSIKDVKNDVGIDVDIKLVLENNTKAVVELTQFLQTQAAVDKEKEKHSSQQLTDILAKTDTVIEKLDNLATVVTTHTVKCDASCRQ